MVLSLQKVVIWVLCLHVFYGIHFVSMFRDSNIKTYIIDQYELCSLSEQVYGKPHRMFAVKWFGRAKQVLVWKYKSG